MNCFLLEFSYFQLCYTTHKGALPMALHRRVYLFYIPLWGYTKPDGIIFFKNFLFLSCAMVSSDAGFTYWFSQNCMPATGKLVALVVLLYKVFLPEFAFLKVCYGSLRCWIYLLDSSERLHVLILSWEMAASPMQFFART